MPTKGVKDVNRSMGKLLERVGNETTEKVMTEILIEGLAAAAAITPSDTSTLVNSQYKSVRKSTSGYEGFAGYAADYAAYVNDAPGTLKGKPRQDFGMTSNRSEFGPAQPKAFGGGTGKGNYWDPNGEPGFLKKGFERDAVDSIRQIIREGYKIK